MISHVVTDVVVSDVAVVPYKKISGRRTMNWSWFMNIDLPVVVVVDTVDWWETEKRFRLNQFECTGLTSLEIAFDALISRGWESRETLFQVLLTSVQTQMPHECWWSTHSLTIAVHAIDKFNYLRTVIIVESFVFALIKECRQSNFKQYSRIIPMDAPAPPSKTTRIAVAMIALRRVRVIVSICWGLKDQKNSNRTIIEWYIAPTGNAQPCLPPV